MAIDTHLMETEFVYEPLPQGYTRILDLFPGQPSDPLVLSLSVEPFDAAPYTAVSYCWGSDERPHRVACGYSTVRVGGQDGLTVVTPARRPSGYLRITNNLWLLLRAVRQATTYSRLWVDAVCINQADPREKATEVRRLDSIFDNAYATMVYAGEWTPEVNTAWRCAAVLAHMKDWPTLEVDQALRQIEDVQVGVGDGRVLSFRAMWTDFVTFLARPWFRRVWTVQEAMLSRDLAVSCGATSWSWEVLVDACDTVLRHGIRPWDQHVQRCADLLALDRRRKGYFEIREQVEDDGEVDWAALGGLEHDMHLTTMQAWTRGRGATDPRDKIFALANVSLGDRDLWPKVDYDVAVPLLYSRMPEVWCQMMPAAPLLFLSCVTNTTQTVDLPSWVPDWRVPWRGESLAHLATDGKGASGDLACEVVFPVLDGEMERPPPQLAVRGARLLTVLDTEALKLSGDDWRAGRHAALIGRFADPYPTTKLTYLEAFSRAGDPQVPRDFETIPGRTEKFWDFMVDAPRLRGSLSATSDHQTYAMEDCPPAAAQSSASLASPRYTQDALYETLPASYRVEYSVVQEGMIHGRKWFVAEEGFMGLVPEQARSGDQICMLFGGRVLYVVRLLRVDERGRRVYKFVGECFVYGLMDGEATVELPEELVGDFFLE